MEKISKLYQELHLLGKQNLGDSHGVFITHKGDNTKPNPILFVGRETRGMGTSINQAKLPISKFAEGDLFWLDNKKDGYYYGTSPFWRVVGKSASKIEDLKYDYDVFETIFWTNLYKIAPVTKKPNLKSTKNIQRDICIELLIEEIKLIKPKLVVFLTGEWIHHFQNKWTENKLISTSKSKEKDFFNSSFNFIFDDINIPAIVVPHPQGKPESEIVKLICETELELLQF